MAAALACANPVHASAPPAALTTTEDVPVTVAESGTNLYGLTAPANGTAAYAGGVNLDANVAGSITYTPKSGFVGTDSFTYEYCYLSDPGRGSCTPHTMTVTVGSAAPTAGNGSITTAYDTAGSTVLTGAGGVTGYAIVAGPAHGSVSISGATATYTPFAGYSGGDSFTFEATGPGGVSAPATVSVSVGPPAAPTVANGSINTPYNTPATVTLPGSGVVTGYGLVAGPGHGTAVILGSSVTYSPASGYYGADSFTYDAVGPGGTSAVATIAVTVGVPPAPTPSNGAISTAYNTAGSTTLAASGVVTSYAVVTGPAHGAVVISGASAIYTPNGGYFGSDSFTFSATGPGGTSAPATVTVTVGAPPAPTASGGAISTAYNTAGSTSLTASGLVTSYGVVTDPSHGAAVISGASAIYTPNDGYFGSDSFTFSATGPGGTSAPATVTVAVGAPPAPTASGGAITTAYETSGSTTLTASGLVTGYVLVTGPSHGAAVISGASAIYTPNAGYSGPDSFTVQAVGPGGRSGAATIAVTVGPPPAPTAANGSITTAYDTAATLTLSGSGVISRYAIAANPSHGAVVLSGASATYTPSASYFGADSFSFTVSGPGGAAQPGLISITVLPPPAPVANSASLTCAYQTPCSITLTSTGVTSAYLPGTQATNGSCTISGDVLAYTPAWGAVGADSCTFVATGPGGASAPATIYITNEPPPLPQGSGGQTGTPMPTSGASLALCSAGQSASIPGLPGPPTGSAFDPNWCNEQALTIAQQALRLQNQLSQITKLQSQVAAAQRMVQGLGSDSTSAPLAAAGAQLAAILQQATGIGFNAQTAGANFAAAYPATAVTAGFNGDQLAAALQTWGSNTRQALQASIAVQNAVAQTGPAISSAVGQVVARSNAAVGATAAHQATNQLIAAVSAQLGQLQDILITEAQAYSAVEAASRQAAGVAAAVTSQTQAEAPGAMTAPPGVDDTTHM